MRVKSPQPNPRPEAPDRGVVIKLASPSDAMGGVLLLALILPTAAASLARRRGCLAEVCVWIEAGLRLFASRLPTVRKDRPQTIDSGLGLGLSCDGLRASHAQQNAHRERHGGLVVGYIIGRILVAYARLLLGVGSPVMTFLVLRFPSIVR